MSAFLSMSLWITLATIVPGLVTIAVVYLSFVIITPKTISDLGTLLPHQSDWLWAAVAITIMVMTQKIGILLEWVLVRYRLLGARKTIKEPKILTVPEGFDPLGETEIPFKPYDYYHGLYILIAQLREDEDTHGHLKRSLAQFFLTNNTLVSLVAGIAVSLSLVLCNKTAIAYPNALAYILLLFACLVVTYFVAIIRFQVMTKQLLAANRFRQKRDKGEQSGQASTVVILNAEE